MRRSSRRGAGRVAPDLADAPAGGRPRRIIHIDMDAFYASVEQRDAPALRGRPVAVGGSSGRGVVAAASYEARAFGVRSAMPSVVARRLCPDLLFVKPRFEAYHAVSQAIRAIFAEFTPLIEPLSLDEAYLDVTGDPAGLGSATATARAIRARILAVTGLTASAGVSCNKLVAKLASDHHKPDGLCVVPPARAAAFVAALPVARLHGVGPVTAAKMERLGIRTGADLAARDMAALEEAFGVHGRYLYWAARGRDDREVRAHRVSKSVGAERTFDTNILAPEALRAALGPIADAAWERVDRKAGAGRTVTLKLRYADFRQITRAKSLPAPVRSRAAFLEVGQALLDPLCPPRAPVRLLGLTLSALGDVPERAAPASVERQLGLPL